MVTPEPQFSPTDGAAEPYTVLLPDGTLRDGATPSMSDDEVVEALRLMLLTRTFDDKAFRMQRQGRFGTFSQVRGQEAAVTGSATALDPQRDWVVPQYRELPALLRQGLPLTQFILYFTGNPAGGGVPEGVNCLPLNIALAAQVPHAVGLGWGLRQQGSDAVVITYFGDGASSEGDVHEALNLAGIVKAPVIFFLSNNGWAISTPRSKQSAALTLASRAIGYGMPGVVVDGNDLLAVHEVTAQAVRRARAGEGPTLIEAITYRTGPHNTADDPSRYVDDKELEHWRRLDPVDRVRRYLTARGRWNDEIEAEVDAQNKATVDEAFAAAAAHPAVHADQLFAHLYHQFPSRVSRQRAEFASHS